MAGITWKQACAQAEQNGESVKPAFCPMCGPGSRCRMYAFCKDGRLTRVAGMAESAWSRGVLCMKGRATPEWVHSPDRLKKPLLRTGARGEGKFAEISWDEAIARVADKLMEQKRKYGPESLAILSPAGRNYKDISLRFLALHGSPNHAHSGICALQRAFAFAYTLGTPAVISDFDNAEMIVYWGRQPVYSGPATPSARQLRDARRRGTKIVMIKPSREADAAEDDLWLPVRPGTDAALALALLQVVCEENLVDREFVDRWCFGFPELRAHVRDYTPEWAETLCGVPAKQIRDFARLYATTPAACIETGNGLEHAASSCDAVRAIAMLMAVTGHLNRSGGNHLQPDRPGSGSLRKADLCTGERLETLAAPEFPLPFQPFIEGPSSSYYKTIESILTEKPYPVRALLAPGTQPLVSNRGPRQVLEAPRKVEFFVISDVQRTAELPYADIVLPNLTQLETDFPFDRRDGLLLPHRAVLEPQCEGKSIFDFFLDLGVACGYGADFWNGSRDEFENEMLRPYGLSIEELRRHPEGIPLPPPSKTPVSDFSEVLSCPSPRLGRKPYLPQEKIALFNTEFETAGYEPMPVWREPPDGLPAFAGPESDASYPLLLSDYHTSVPYSASWLRNVPSLRRYMPDPVLHIHPEAATRYGVEDGWFVRVENPRGWLKVRAKVTDRIRPDTVMLLHGWWQGCSELGYPDLPLTDGGANVNLLYSVEAKAFDPLTSAPASQTLVRVSPWRREAQRSSERSERARGIE